MPLPMYYVDSVRKREREREKKNNIMTVEFSQVSYYLTDETRVVNEKNEICRSKSPRNRTTAQKLKVRAQTQRQREPRDPTLPCQPPRVDLVSATASSPGPVGAAVPRHGMAMAQGKACQASGARRASQPVQSKNPKPNIANRPPPSRTAHLSERFLNSSKTSHDDPVPI